MLSYAMQEGFQHLSPSDRNHPGRVVGYSKIVTGDPSKTGHGENASLFTPLGA